MKLTDRKAYFRTELSQEKVFLRNKHLFNPISHGLFLGLILHGGGHFCPPHVYREPFTPWASNFAQI